MLFKDVHIEKVKYLLPESVVSSHQIEEYLSPLYKTLRLPLGTLENLCGVKERRLWSVDKKPSEGATQVAQNLLYESGCDRSEIDVLIYTGVCRDFLEPATSQIIHHYLSLKPECLTFDLSNACLGIFNGMLLASKLIESKHARKVLLVSSENAAPLLEETINLLNQEKTSENFYSSLASLTLGSGAIAMLLTHSSESSTEHKILGGVSRIASEHHNLCQGIGDYFHPKMKTDSTNLLKEGIKLSKRTWDSFLETLKKPVEDYAHVLTHQVSLTHYEKVFQTLGIPKDKGRVDCRFYGNTGTVAAPLSLALSDEEGILKAKDNIAFLGIGSGLNAMMLGLQW